MRTNTGHIEKRTEFETKTIERANELVRYHRDELERAAGHMAELEVMKRLAPWAFEEDGSPKEEAKRLGGRME